MNVLNRLAHLQGRRDERPNQDLARALASKRDRAGIREIARNLWNPDRNIQADCIKVMYEVGALDPKLIVPYADDFARLLSSRNNRMVWGAMTALGEVARADPRAVFRHVAAIKHAIENGSVITIDNAIIALALTSAAATRHEKTIFPYLLAHLSSCRPKDVTQHSEKSLAAVNARNKDAFVKVLEIRLDDLSGAALSRVKRVIKLAKAME